MMLKAQADVIRVAMETQKESDIHHIAMHTPMRTEYPINSYVIVKYENKEHKPPSKFHPYKKGPFRVVNFNGNIYTVENLVTFKKEDYHITNISPYEYDPTFGDPRDAANADQDAVDVEEILQHRGERKRNKKKKCDNDYYLTTLEFLVKWTDGTESWNSWSNMRRTEACCHKYLEANNMKQHILFLESFCFD